MRNGKRTMSIECPEWDSAGWAASAPYIEYCIALLRKHLRLPQSGRLVDLGCGRGHLTAALANSLPATMAVEAVDPSATVMTQKHNQRLNVSCNDALSYITRQPDAIYDGVIMKQMFHLIGHEYRRPLLQHVRRTLKPQRHALILIMPPTLTMPMFQRAKETFMEGQMHFNDIVELASTEGFSASVTEASFPVRLSKTGYFSLIRSRFLSNLQHLNNEEIEEGCSELAQRFANETEITFEDQIFVINLTIH